VSTVPRSELWLALGDAQQLKSSYKDAINSYNMALKIDNREGDGLKARLGIMDTRDKYNKAWEAHDEEIRKMGGTILTSH
jgi:tetratricopeptide (TPR) repeat protein